MSEESLRRFLDRLASDSDFVERLKANPEATLAESDLSATERVALASNDEDGLRRLAGRDVAGFAFQLAPSGVICLGAPLFVSHNTGGGAKAKTAATS